MASMLPPPRLKADLRQASHMGRTGRDGVRDSLIAHLNPREAELLKLIGGAGTRNPRTGLLEFRVGGSMGAGADGGNSNDRTGRDAGNGGGSGGSHGGSGAYNGQGRPNAAAVSVASGLRGPLGPNGDAGFTNQTGPAGAPTGQSTPTQGGGVGSNYEAARSDYINRDFATRLVDFFSPFGEDEPDINAPKTYENGLAHWSVNPASLAGMVVGGVTGVPFVSTALGAAYHAAGLPNVRIGNASPGTPGPEVHDFSGGTPNAGAPTSGNQGRGTILPPIAGNPGSVATPGIPAPPVTGSLLPPISAPSMNVQPGGYRPIPGPSPYGVQLPSWLYR